MVYRLAERYDIPILFHSGWDNSQYSSPEIIKDTAEKNPSIRLICCHCCYPNLKGCFDVLAKYDNVHFDISSVADGDTVNKETLVLKGLANKADELIKVLGDGELTKKLTVAVDKVSASAKEKIEKAGGSVTEQ